MKAGFENDGQLLRSSCRGRAGRMKGSFLERNQQDG